MSDDDALVTYRPGKAASITLDAPRRRNALSRRMIAQLRAAVAEAAADDAVRVIVLEHTGPVFCAGADLRESAAASQLDQLPAAHLAELLADLCEAPKPVVAVAAGGAMGGGMGLLAAADIAVCDRTARLSFAEVRLGVVPAVIGPVVERKLGAALMRRLFLTGETFTTAQALQWGLVSVATTAASAHRHRSELMEQLVAGGPGAQAGIKAVTAAEGLRERLREAAATTAEYFFSDEGREGVASFLEKRSPSWVH